MVALSIGQHETLITSYQLTTAIAELPCAPVWSTNAYISSPATAHNIILKTQVPKSSSSSSALLRIDHRFN